MAPYKSAKALFTLAKESISNFIVTTCKTIEDDPSFGGNLTYDNPACAALVQTFRDELLAVALVPPSMWNFLCEASLACNDNLKSTIRDRRILYSVLVNNNVTKLKVRGKKDHGGRYGIEHILPCLTNMVKLDMSAVHCDGLLYALSYICRKLEDISFNKQTSPDVIRSFINLCPKLRNIRRTRDVVHTYISYEAEKEILIQALTSLPDLEYCFDVEMAARVMEMDSTQNQGPFKLRRLFALDATPSYVLAFVNMCPHLQELDLSLSDDRYEDKILNILTASNLKVKVLSFSHLNLSCETVEKFFIAKGKYVEDLELYCCHATDQSNFVRFIGSSCKYLRKLRLSNIWPSKVSNFEFNISFLHTSLSGLQELEVHQSYDNVILVEYDGNFVEIDFPEFLQYQTKMIATLMICAPSLEKLDLSLENWASVYPSDDALEKMFPVARLTKLQSLTVQHLPMTERIASYFIDNCPSLTKFVVPIEVTDEACEYLDEVKDHCQSNNINLMIFNSEP